MTTGATSGRWRDLPALTLIAVALRLPAVLSSRHLSFDDGVYGATAVALRQGARPYRDVFSSQGPLHHPLLWLADLAGGRSSIGPRLLPLASGVVITLAVYLTARHLADRRAGWIAALLATSAGSVLLVTTGTSGDGPAIAFAVSAVAVALAVRDRSGWVGPVVVGLLVGCTVSVKLLAAPVVVPVALVLLARRRTAQTIVAGSVAAAVPLVAAAPWGYARVWDQSVRYHQEARRYSVGSAAWRMVSTLATRDVLVVVTVLVVLVAALAARDRWRAPSGPRWSRVGTALGAWLVVQVVFLLVESAMWLPHVSELVVPLCLLAALRLPRTRVLVAPWVLGAVVWAASDWRVVRPGTYRRGDPARVAVERIRPGRGCPDDLVVTDEPGLAWRAGAGVPWSLVDTSVKRFDQGRITEATVLDAARDPRTTTVLVTDPHRLGRWPDLPDRLGDLGYARMGLPGGRDTLYVRGRPHTRTGCAPLPG